MRTRRADLLVGLACAGAGAASGLVEGLGVAGLAGGAVVGAALGTARSKPQASWSIAAAALIALAFAGGPSVGIVLLAGAHAFFAARWSDQWSSVAGIAALVGALEFAAALGNWPPVPALLIPATAWAAGRALRERELMTTALAERARELEREREAHAALSVRYERARIASELHDIVAHAISVMVVQASAGQRLAAHDADATEEAFDAIAGAARQAEEDMGRLVVLLGDETAIGTAPDLALVDELVERAARSGLDVTMRLEGRTEGLPADVAELAYRVVQESLTNALRYAAGATVRVSVRGGEDTLTITVENGSAQASADLAGGGTGSGLHGLRERVTACGGTLAAGPTAAGGWRVNAELPRRIAPRPRGQKC